MSESESSNLEVDATRSRLEEIVKRVVAFRKEIQPELEEAINEFLRKQTPQNAIEKKQLAHQVTGLLSGLGFAIEHSGVPCSLYAHISSRDSQGRFRIQPRASKSPLVYSKTIAEMLPFSIVDISTPQMLSKGDLAKDQNEPNTWRDLVNKDESKDRTP